MFIVLLHFARGETCVDFTVQHYYDTVKKLLSKLLVKSLYVPGT